MCLCRYSLLLKELLKMDPSKSAALQAVLHDLMKVAEHVNEGVRTRHVLVECRGFGHAGLFSFTAGLFGVLANVDARASSN